MGMLVSPYRHGGSSGTAGYLSAESLTESTFTTASSDVITLSGATLKANTNYFMFASVDAKSSATVSDVGLNLFNGATQLNAERANYETTAAGTDYRNLSFMRRVTTSATASSDSWIMRLQQDSAGSTITYKNARLVLIEVGTNDQYAESRAHGSYSAPTSNSSQTVCTLSFTPPSAGDYLIIGYLVGDKVTATNTTFAAELTDGTTTTTEQSILIAQTTERMPIPLILKMTGMSGSKTFSLKIRETGTGSTTIGYADCCIMAIRLSRFANVYSVSATGPSNTTSGTYSATAADQTFTPAAADHFTIAWAEPFTPATATSSLRYDDSGTIVNESATRSNFNNLASPMASVRIATYAASSRRQKIEHKTTAGTLSTWLMHIHTLDLTGI